MQDPLLAFRRVTLRYDDGPPALHAIDFKAAQGSATAIVGASGAGKTSFLNLASLTAAPTDGRITLFGVDPWGGRRSKLTQLRRRVGLVAQTADFVDHLTAFENVALPLRLRGRAHKEYREDVAELLTWVGLEDKMEALPPTLSGGQKQRVAIARAVVGKPDLILADEPTGSVDPEMGARLMRLLMELNRLGATLIVATHDDRVLRHMRSRVIRLADGRIDEAQQAA